MVFYPFFEFFFFQRIVLDLADRSFERESLNCHLLIRDFEIQELGSERYLRTVVQCQSSGASVVRQSGNGTGNQ